MTDPRQCLRDRPPITTTDELAAFWRALAGEEGFGRRTLWLVLLGDDGRPTPVVIPVDDLPALPLDRDVRALATVLDGVRDLGHPVLLLSRPGPAGPTEADRFWARALTPLSPGWPVHLATGGSSSGPPCVVLALDGTEVSG